jgi:hypothetical protein
VSGQPLREEERNALLRQVDWRFLLRSREAPRALDLGFGRGSRALRLAFEPAAETPGGADLVVLGRPGPGKLRAARDALRPAGELVCVLRAPLPGGAARAQRRLQRAGFEDVRLYWPGPVARRAPQFWLSLDSPAAAADLLAQRPARSAGGSALRGLWRRAARGGMLAPLYAIARAPLGPGEEAPAPDEIDSLLPGSASWLLLTGGRRSINKVVGLPFTAGLDPLAAVKIARVPEAEPGLEREAEALRTLELERPEVAGIPRLITPGRRSGRLALAETHVRGRPLLELLTAASFEEHAARITRWLIELARGAPVRPRAEWWPRLVTEPVEEFERSFGAVLEPGSMERVRSRLEDLGDLPQVCEHRDCAPWNVLLQGDDTPALLDWESAEVRGLPGLDLAYFLANSAFVLDGALESGRTRESYALLLDPSTPTGRVAAAREAEYCAGAGIDHETLPRLRLLCWIVHSRSDHRHLEMEAAGAPGDDALRRSLFLGLVEEELSRPQEETCSR